MVNPVAEEHTLVDPLQDPEELSIRSGGVTITNYLGNLTEEQKKKILDIVLKAIAAILLIILGMNLPR